MSRTLTELATASVQTLLDRLASPATLPEEYKQTMYQLGFEHGKSLRRALQGKAVGIACTVEDADFLAKGIIEGLEDSANSISVAYFLEQSIPGG